MRATGCPKLGASERMCIITMCIMISMLWKCCRGGGAFTLGVERYTFFSIAYTSHFML